MKSLLLIVASLFAYNENVNFYENTSDIFDLQSISFNTSINTYKLYYEHPPTSMSQFAFTSFKNGSSYLYYEIPSDFNVDYSKPNLFYIDVESAYTNRYFFEAEFDYLTTTYHRIPNFFEAFDYTAMTNITISIPTLDDDPVINYPTFLGASKLATLEGYKELVYDSIYFDGYSDGLYDGWDDGYYLGDYEGFLDGYDIGYEEGVIAGQLGELPDLFTILGQGFSSISSILAISLFPGFTLGLLLFLPLIFGIAYVLIKLLLGNG